MIRLKVPCTLQYRDLAMRTVAAACRIVRPRRATDSRQADVDFDDQVVTSFGEAFTNVVQHGAGGAEAPDIEIRYPDPLRPSHNQAHGSREAVRPLDNLPPDLGKLPESGLGVHIMKSWMDDVSYRRGEPDSQRGPNVLSMTKRLGDFSRTDDGDETVLSISGVLDAVTAPNIRRTIDVLVAEQRRAITLELSGLRMIDSSGVGVIVSLYKRCKAFGGTVRIAGLKDQPLAIFKLLRLDRVFTLP